MKDLEDGGEAAEGSDEEGGEVGCNWIEKTLMGNIWKWVALPRERDTVQISPSIFKNAWRWRGLEYGN